MKTPFDALEDRLNALRPSPLPATARRHIVHEMERRAIGHKSTFWAFCRHAGFQAAIAGALSVALVAGWNWLPRPSRPVSRGDTAEPAANVALLPSLASWETKLAAAYPVGENTVAVLLSPSILTNIQIRR